MFYKYIIMYYRDYMMTIVKLLCPGFFMWFFLYFGQVEKTKPVELHIDLLAYKVHTISFVHWPYHDEYMDNMTVEYLDIFPVSGLYHTVEVVNETLDKFLLKLGKSDPDLYFMEAMSGLSVLGPKKVMAWFNNQFYHSIPITLQLIYDAVLNIDQEKRYSLKVSNYPIAKGAADVSRGGYY